MQPFITSKAVQIVLGVLIVLLLLCLAFLAGVKTNERRTRHFSNWCDHYPDMLKPHRGSKTLIPAPPHRPMPLPNGVFGRILSATGTNFMIEGQDQFEQNVLITSSTVLRVDRGTASLGDLRPDREVGVFGLPNEQGQIEARLIRLFPTRP